MPRRKLSYFEISSLAAGSLLISGAAMPAPWPLWLAAATLGAYAVLLGMGITIIRMSFFCRAVCRGTPGEWRLALTFDDGPDPVATPAVLDLLREANVPATFFCIGSNIAQDPELCRRTIAEGHEIGNHTFRHAWWTNFLSGKRLHDEIERSGRLIQEVTGRPVRYFRTPMGLTNPHLAPVLRRLGLQLIGWDVRTFDQRARTSQHVVKRILSGCRDGSIILLHDGGANVELLITSLRTVIYELQSQGYRFVGLGELLTE